MKIPSQRVLAHTTFTWFSRNVATFLNLCDTPGEVHLWAPLFRLLQKWCVRQCTYLSSEALWKKKSLHRACINRFFWVALFDLFQLIFNITTAT